MRYVTSIGRGDSEDAIFIFMTGEETGAELRLNGSAERGEQCVHMSGCVCSSSCGCLVFGSPQTVTNVRSRKLHNDQKIKVEKNKYENGRNRES
jgi:hypothetical protein